MKFEIEDSEKREFEEILKRKNGHYVDKPIPYEQILEEDRIDATTKLKPREVVVTIDQSYFAVKNNISVVGGLPKAGKTSISTPILATCTMDQVPEELDTLQIRSTPAKGLPFGFIDTEQDRFDTNKLRNSVLQMAGLERDLENFFIFNIKKYTRTEKLKRVHSIIKAHPESHLWIIDGIADLVKDPNNADSSFEVIDQFLALAEEHNMALIFYLHENPGSSKLRGNLGSEIERKCYGAINIKKDRVNKIHIVESRVCRGSQDFDNIEAKYDPELKRLVSLTADQKEAYRKLADPKQKKKEELIKAANRIFLQGSEEIAWSEMQNRLVVHSVELFGKQISISTAKNRIQDLKDFDLIEQDENTKKYRMKRKKSKDTEEAPF